MAAALGRGAAPVAILDAKIPGTHTALAETSSGCSNQTVCLDSAYSYPEVLFCRHQNWLYSQTGPWMSWVMYRDVASPYPGITAYF